MDAWWNTGEWKAFCSAAAANRRDTVAPLVAADWLDERDCPRAAARAEIVRATAGGPPVYCVRGSGVRTLTGRDAGRIAPEVLDRATFGTPLHLVERFTLTNGFVSGIEIAPWRFCKGHVGSVMRAEKPDSVAVSYCCPAPYDGNTGGAAWEWEEGIEDPRDGCFKTYEQMVYKLATVYDDDEEIFITSTAATRRSIIRQRLKDGQPILPRVYQANPMMLPRPVYEGLRRDRAGTLITLFPTPRAALIEACRAAWKVANGWAGADAQKRSPAAPEPSYLEELTACSEEFTSIAGYSPDLEGDRP